MWPVGREVATKPFQREQAVELRVVTMVGRGACSRKRRGLWSPVPAGKLFRVRGCGSPAAGPPRSRMLIEASERKKTNDP